MAFVNPLSQFLNYINGNGSGSAPPVTQTPTPSNVSGYTPVTASSPMHPTIINAGGAHGFSPYNYRYSNTTGKPVADLPRPEEDTVLAFPTIHSLQPTRLNEGKPWAGQKVPTGYLDGLAYAENQAKRVGGFDDQTLKQFLPLGIRESRYNDYGNNGVWVDYKTPPPKELQGVIAQSNAAAAQEIRFRKLGENAKKNHRLDLADDMKLQENLAKRQKEKFDETILSNPNWNSRSSIYKDITNKAQELGLPQSTRQEVIRNKETGQLIGKADVYRASEKDSYSTKALHVPLALYNKMKENPHLAGLNLTKRYIGSGVEADARSKQEAEISKNIYTHLKNKPLLDYYNSRKVHHSLK